MSGLVRRVQMLACAVLAVAGCSHSVGGLAVAKRAPDSPAARTQLLRQLIPGDGEISEAMATPMKSAFIGRLGGLEMLPSGKTDASPMECLGAATPGMQQIYRAAPVSGTIKGEWESVSSAEMFPTPDYYLSVTVVELDSSASAHSFYARSLSQWQGCQGRSVRTKSAIIGADSDDFAEITHVSEDGGVLNAVVLDKSGETDSHPLPQLRALVAVSRYLVDVGVAQIVGRPDEPTTSDPAVAVARMIANRIISTG